jgi:hypothetical protein
MTTRNTETETPIRARLASGEIVVLEQDCDCVIHTVHAYAQAEQRRLSTKLREMETRRIEEILKRQNQSKP